MRSMGSCVISLSCVIVRAINILRLFTADGERASDPAVQRSCNGVPQRSCKCPHSPEKQQLHLQYREGAFLYNKEAEICPILKRSSNCTYQKSCKFPYSTEKQQVCTTEKQQVCATEKLQVCTTDKLQVPIQYREEEFLYNKEAENCPMFKRSSNCTSQNSCKWPYDSEKQ